MRSDPLDTVDQDLLARRIAQRDALDPQRPRIGDFVQFADRQHPARRFAHPSGEGIQTTDGGSFHLGGGGGMGFSGSLWPCVPYDTLTLTDQRLEGSVWFFHHDFPTAGGSVTVYIPHRVYLCALPTNYKA